MARIRFPAWEFFSRRSKFFLKTSAIGHDNQRIQSTQHPHPLDDVIHWLINEQEGRINNKNHWKLLVCSTFLHSINRSIYTREKSSWKAHKIDGTATFTIAFGGSVVEFSPATRETGVRLPANAKTKFLKKYHCDEMLVQLQMCWKTSAHYSSHVV